MNQDNLKDRKDARNHDLELLKMRLNKTVSETEQALAVGLMETSREGLIASIHSQDSAQERAPVWALAIISLIRPFVTLLLLLITIWAALPAIETAANANGLSFDTPDETIRSLGFLFSQLEANPAIAVILELTAMSVAWWFGDRSFKRAVQHSQLGGSLRSAGQLSDGQGETN